MRRKTGSSIEGNDECINGVNWKLNGKVRKFRNSSVLKTFPWWKTETITCYKKKRIDLNLWFMSTCPNCVLGFITLYRWHHIVLLSLILFPQCLLYSHTQMCSQTPKFGTGWLNVNQYSVVVTYFGQYPVKYLVLNPISHSLGITVTNNRSEKLDAFF